MLKKPKVKIEREYGVYADNRKILIEAIDKMGIKRPKGIKSYYLAITLSCGKTKTYQTKKDIPKRSVRCNCGKKKYEHWFIKYEDKKIKKKKY